MSKNEFDSSQWWATSIIRMSPGEIAFHGYSINELIGHLSFSSMIWLMLRGDVPTASQETLLSAALMAGVDHGPQAPSIAVARMAMSCGVGVNNAMASATNTLGDVHGGAGEQAHGIFTQTHNLMKGGVDIKTATTAAVRDFLLGGRRYVSGFGHRFHPVDPRTGPLIDLLRKHETDEGVTSGYADIAVAVEHHISSGKNKVIPMNIDGATAAIYCALGFSGQACRGLFVLSRSVGILAHALEQGERSERNKGPMPKGQLWAYEGKPPRSIHELVQQHRKVGHEF